MLNVGKGFGRYRNRSVVVSSDGFAVRGVMELTDRDVIVLRDCHSIDADMGTRPIDGRVVIPLHKIQYVQVK